MSALIPERKRIRIAIPVIVLTVLLLLLLAALSIAQIVVIADRYESVVQSLERLKNECELPLTTPPQLNLLWLIGSVVLMTLLSTISSVVVFLVVNRQYNQQINRYERQILKTREESRLQTLKDIALELVADQDVLSELTTWLQKYHHHKEDVDVDSAAYIHLKVLERLVKQVRLRPIARIGDLVKFNPQIHIAYDDLKIGEEAVVKEPGWRVGTEPIKKTIVRRN